ncbi:putative histidinol-phosphate aminotransferase (plasmid) [Selenomonas ruminantium subsp. lactilytica TAM6421]|uniref:Histidinol-phosphate aminotransferase n=1 Tax=Selenomonas ruminantium subsp. lactilytica (strain NBRC 103574 / TAM6421) TaxID=927704 RepID=I0GWC0_SELRL|nr:histidinol-phosphate transaminase [Selenomonas ruminantium]BAL85057.1 putative histidinol-phosphate aminotransferase [Selenomonas ruminantium subsp. lactilytica TAM6421]
MSLADNIRKVTPYTPGEQPQHKVIKLNTNEFPYPPSPKVVEAIRAINASKLRLYPDPDCRELRETLAEEYGLEPEQVFVGVGSDDVLSMCFLTYFAGKKPILFNDITYSFYEVWADVYRIPYETVPLREDFTFDPAGFIKENGGIVICNPNAPTSLEANMDDIEKVVAENQDSVVLIDEAYVDFGGHTALPLLKKYPNVVIIRTMSKSRALAGLRIGYAFGSRELIKALHDVKFSVNSYTLNMPSLAAGVAAANDREYFEETVDRVLVTREKAQETLRAFGFTVLESRTNFLFAKPPASITAENLFEQLKERNIYVRYFKKPRLSEYLRITIGTDTEMQEFVKVLQQILP